MDIKKVLSEMTLEEKCALLSGVTNWDTTPIERLSIPSTKCADGPCGLRKEIPTKEINVLGQSVPATCFPLPVTLASSWDTEIEKLIGKALAEEAIDQGVQTVLGPGINIKRSPLCGRNFEYLSEDPFLAGRMATSFVLGVQSLGIGTSLKHFAVNSQEYRRMMISSEVDERALREIYLPAFEMTIKEAQPYTVMCSYNRINGTFSSDNKYLLTDILRNEWEFKGIVMSDWGAVNDRVAGVKAGLDLEMPTSEGTYDRIVLEALKNKQLEESELNCVVERNLAYLDKITENTKNRQPSICDYEAHHQLARQAAASGAVLLKNEHHLLPIRSNQTIAVIGHLAKRMRYEGNGSSLVNPRHLVQFTEVLDQEHVKYEYADGYTSGTVLEEKEFAEAVRIAKDKDVVLVFVGLTEEYESEGFDRTHLELPASHNELISKLSLVNNNIVVVLSIGAPVKTPWISSVNTVLNLYLGGEAAGEGAFDVIFGKTNPSGKLAETFPLSLDQNPASKHFHGGPKTVEYRESIYVGYRYFDKTKKDVLFPFGFGLSYSHFDYSNLKVSSSHIRDGKATLTFDIKNTGGMDGAEVAQVYIRDVDSTIFREDKALKGFAKVFIKSGETVNVTIELDSRSWAFYNVLAHDWTIESGHFDILVGSSSRDIRLKENVYVEGNSKNIPDYSKVCSAYYALHKTKDYPMKQFIHLMGHPLSENKRYTRRTLDENATLLDARRVSLNGRIFYNVMKKKAATFIPKDAPDYLVKIVQESAVVGPLRQLISFTRGSISKESLQGLIYIIKGRLAKGIMVYLKAAKAHKKVVSKSQEYPVTE
ncbi:MAG: glycoside hydrolase family 3 C-terminal domain-containing protein [Firmicutes bacterium]|nr:glycoside hydrolase family 3 C-terminal domain-containing protein [Bacillota bacterium]